jgi:multidrug efflux system membrane fusion protein
MKKNTVRFLVGAAVCIAAGAWYYAHQRSVAKPAAAGPPAILVNVVSPQRQDVDVVLQANGSVTPISSVDLHPQTSRTISKVHIREGQFVKAGQAMFSLDARSDRAAIDKARAQVVRDEAALADVQRQHQRSLELLARNFIAQGAVDTLQSQLDAARALLGVDQAALRAVQVEASYAELQAPLTGRVGAINVYPGSLVQPATLLTTITQLDPIDMSFTLPESSLSSLLAADKDGPIVVGATLAGTSGSVDGVLSFIDNTVDPVAGVIRVKARFGNADTRLWPGQYANMQLTLKTLKDVLVIPQNAIIDNTLGTFVYVMQADQTVAVRNVQRLHAFGVNAAVAGLNEVDKVVVEGKQSLRPGALVRLNAAPAAAASASAGQPK